MYIGFFLASVKASIEHNPAGPALSLKNSHRAFWEGITTFGSGSMCMYSSYREETKKHKHSTS